MLDRSSGVAARSVRTLTIRMRAIPAKSSAARALAEAESSPLPRRRWRRWRRRRRKRAKREGSTTSPSPSPAPPLGRDAAWPIRFGQSFGEDEPRDRGVVGVRRDGGGRWGQVGRIDARSPRPTKPSPSLPAARARRPARVVNSSSAGPNASCSLTGPTSQRSFSGRRLPVPRVCEKTRSPRTLAHCLQGRV